LADHVIARLLEHPARSFADQTAWNTSRIPSFFELPRNKRIKKGGKPFRKESEGAAKMGTSL